MAICPLYNAGERKCPLNGDPAVNLCENYRGYCAVLIDEADKSNKRVREVLLRAARLNLKSKLEEVN